MFDITQLLNWFMSGEGRLVAAALLFTLMWAVKSLSALEPYLNTPRSKQAVNLLLAMTPAVWLMVEGASPVEVSATAIGIALSAHGINTLRPSKSKVAKKTFAMMLFLALVGCSATGPILKGVSDALSIIDTVAAGAQKYFDRHPSMEREDEIGEALKLVREATKAENREKAIELYDDLRQKLDDFGIIDAVPPDGGAETNAPKPEPLNVPTTAEFESTL
jgi:hypothetical protein